MDLSGYTNLNLEIPHVASELVDISSTDHTFTRGAVRAIFIEGTGNIKVEYENNLSTHTIPIVVPAGGHFPLSGYFTKVFKTGTTCTGMNGKY